MTMSPSQLDRLYELAQKGNLHPRALSEDEVSELQHLILLSRNILQ